MSQWILNLHKCEYRELSQSGQDGILNEIFKNIGTTNKYFVEFGQSSTTLECSNTGNLFEKEGWKGLMMDGAHENPDINLHKEFITSENIVSLFDKYNVPSEPDYVSIDIDSCDLWVLRSILSSKYKPRVITCEYNSLFGIHESVTMLNMPEYKYRGDTIFGASLAAINKVGKEHGYTLVHVVERLDAFLVRNDLIEGVPVPPLEFFSNKTGIPPHPHPQNMKFYNLFQQY